MSYDHTQTGWMFINIMMVMLVLLTLTYVNRWGTRPIPFYGFMIVVAIFAIVLSVFFKLRIRIDDQAIHVIYGIGLVHIRIKPERVERVRVFRIPWYYGVGIRVTPRGMLYSINGLDAVEIEFVRGIHKRVLIGSDDCQNLKRVIESRYNVPPGFDHTSTHFER